MSAVNVSSLQGDIGVEFERFLSQEKYRRALALLRLRGCMSLEVDFMDLSLFSIVLADKVLNEPDWCLERFESAAMNRLSIEDPFYAEEIRGMEERLHVRFLNLPYTTPIRAIRASHIGKLIMVEGIVVRSTPVQPFITKAVYACRGCSGKAVVNFGGDTPPPPPSFCSKCRRRGPFDLLKSESRFIDSQEMRVQERPEELPPGQTPRYIDLHLVGSDVVELARPGDHVRVAGVVRAKGKAPGKPHEISLDVNSIAALSKEPEAIEITPEEEQRILEISRAQNAYEMMVASVAPSVFGLSHIKEAILLQLFGGTPKSLPDINIRSEINVLIIGDPGLAKSQLLKHAVALSPRGLYTTGRGTTAAGLTAAVVQSEGGGLTLEAGALVLADRGLCAVDEIEKMRSEDRVAIHEAMEQQTVSIAKGGIVATLNARVAVLAAANPTFGRYDSSRPASDNIPLPPTLLSRFDLIFMIRDELNKEADAELSSHILRLHKAAAPEPPIPTGLLRKYIAYARGRCRPRLSEEALGRIQGFYLEMRRSSEEGLPVAITPRQLESLVRLTEARAKAALRNVATAEDAEAAIRLMRRALLDVGIDVKTGLIDVDGWAVGVPKARRDKAVLILTLIDDLERRSPDGCVSEADLRIEADKKLGIPEIELQKYLSSFLRAGKIFIPKEGFYKRV